MDLDLDWKCGTHVGLRYYLDMPSHNINVVTFSACFYLSKHATFCFLSNTTPSIEVTCCQETNTLSTNKQSSPWPLFIMSIQANTICLPRLLPRLMMYTHTHIISSREWGLFPFTHVTARHVTARHVSFFFFFSVITWVVVAFISFWHVVSFPPWVPASSLSKAPSLPLPVPLATQLNLLGRTLESRLRMCSALCYDFSVWSVMHVHMYCTQRSRVCSKAVATKYDSLVTMVT